MADGIRNNGFTRPSWKKEENMHHFCHDLREHAIITTQQNSELSSCFLINDGKSSLANQMASSMLGKRTSTRTWEARMARPVTSNI